MNSGVIMFFSSSIIQHFNQFINFIKFSKISNDITKYIKKEEVS